MKKIIFCTIIIFFTYSDAISQNMFTYWENLQLKDSLYFYNDIPFTGTSVTLFSENKQPQIIANYVSGLPFGEYKEYYFDKNFKVTNSKDTFAIRILEKKLEIIKNELKQLENDTVKSRDKENNYFEDTFKNQKKFQKLISKEKEDKISKKKSTELLEYRNLVNLKQKSKQKFQEKENEAKLLAQEINKESNKGFYNINVHYQYSVKNKLKHGEFIEYDITSEYIDGIVVFNKKREGIYFQNVQSGEWKFYYPKNKIKAKGNYVNGNETELDNSSIPLNGRDGIWRFFFENGLPMTTVTYSNGKLNGSYTAYYNNGSKKAEGIFNDGIENKFDSQNLPSNGREGNWNMYFENGNLKSELKYQDGIVNGECKAYFENGMQQFVGVMNDNKFNGSFKTFYKNGNLEIVTTYKEDKKNGDFISYHENGKIKESGNYILDEKNGTWIYYNESGNKTAEHNYVNNTRSGKQTDYYTNGNISSEYTIVNGEKNGVIKDYYENGQLKTDAIAKEGKISGPCKSYHENGVMSFSGIFKSGEMNGLATTYDNEGNKIESSNFINGKQNGKSISYYKNGKIQAEVNFKSDKKNGIQKDFLESGELYSEVNFVNNKKHGSSVIYYPNGKIKIKGKIDTLSKAEASLVGDFYEYEENGTIKNHGFAHLDGRVDDKNPTVRQRLSSKEMNKVYKCECCNQPIHGISNGCDADGTTINSPFFLFDPLDVAYLGVKMINEPFEKIYTLLRMSYPYCSKKCGKFCEGN